jgi:hypothetical protein
VVAQLRAVHPWHRITEEARLCSNTCLHSAPARCKQ